MTTSSKRTPSPTNGKKPPIVGFVIKLKDMIDGDGSSSDIISVRKQIVIIELFFGSTRCYTEFNIVVLDNPWTKKKTPLLWCVWIRDGDVSCY